MHGVDRNVMDFPTAIRGLVGAPHLIALRPRGPVLIVTDRNKVVDVRSGKQRVYVGKLSDYLAIDWRVVTGEQLAAMMRPAGQGDEE